jgi:hypothetical protein
MAEAQELETSGYGEFDYMNGDVYIGQWEILDKVKTKENGPMTKWKATGFTSTYPEPDMKATGAKTSITVKGLTFFQTARGTQANGNITKCLAEEYTLILTASTGKASS